jgi:hypothetical protein
MTRDLYYSLGSTREEALKKLRNEEEICGNDIWVATSSIKLDIS